MYRLDFLNDDGSTEPVQDWRGDFICNHMNTARTVATEKADAEDRNVLVSRIGKAGAIRASLVVRPDGSAGPPPGANGACKRAPGQPPCFCPNCRAARRGR